MKNERQLTIVSNGRNTQHLHRTLSCGQECNSFMVRYLVKILNFELLLQKHLRSEIWQKLSISCSQV